MQFSITFPDAGGQAPYLRELIAVMGEMRAGKGISNEQLRRFPRLEAISDITETFPDFDPDTYSITHDPVTDDINIKPVTPEAQADVRALAFALMVMLDDYHQHEDLISFSYVENGMLPASRSHSGGAVVCTSYGWDVISTQSIEDRLRQTARQEIEERRDEIQALVEARDSAPDMMPG